MIQYNSIRQLIIIVLSHLKVTMGKKDNIINKENYPTYPPTFQNYKKNSNQHKSNEPIDNTLMFRKKQWTQKEDKLLIKTIKQYGPKKWSFIAQFIPGRIGKQCRQRWHNHLNPKINKQQWTQVQQWVLFLMHTAFGGKWARMTKTLTKRTDNSIKNHWNSIMQKKIQYFKQKLDQILKKSQLSQMENQVQDQSLNIQINRLLLIIRNGEIAPLSSVSLPNSRNSSQINDEDLSSNIYSRQSKSIGQEYKNTNSINNIRTTNLLQPFRESSQQISNSIKSNEQMEENQILLQKNISFFNNKVETSDIGLQELLQKYDQVPNLTKNASYNYFPNSKLCNIQLTRQQSYQSNRKTNILIDENYQSPPKRTQNYQNVFDQQNQENIALPQVKQLDSPLVPLLRRRSSRNKSFMSPGRFLQRKSSSNQNN